MRAAAIFGPSSSTKDLKPFQIDPGVSWFVGMPTSSGDADVVLILGGDGTVHRHLKQLVELRVPVLVVPHGSGNDFARASNLRTVRDSLQAWRRFLAGGDPELIDLGVIREASGESRKPESKAAGEAPAPHGHYFCCIAGVGLDGEVARRANELPRWLRRHGGYVLSLLPVLLRFAPFLMKISVLKEEQRVEGCAKPTVLATFANTPTYGGGMRIAPKAKIDDGLLDVCVVSDIDKFKLFCLFPTVYFGRHTTMREVDYFQAEDLRLETEAPQDVYADGEYVCRTPVDVSVARGVLTVVV